MKVKRILVILILLIHGCSNPTDRSTNKPNQPEVKYLKVEKAILDFIQLHPNWGQNDIVQEKTFDTLTKQLNPLIYEGLYDDLPFKFEAVEQYQENGKKGYLALFNFDNDKFEYGSMPKKFILSIYGIVDEKMLDTLKQDSSYFLRGKVLKFKTDKFYLIKGSDQSIDMVGLPNIRLKITQVIPVK
jgi:hypothetical protein